MAKVLITGATGFIGSHLAVALATRGDEVACLVRGASRTDRLREVGTRLVLGDVTDAESLPAAVAGQDVVYHLAGRTMALKTRQFYEVNQEGTAKVAAACAQATTPPVLVYVSSQAAAGPAIDGRPRLESDPAAPVSHYGRSKRAGEQAVERLAHRLPVTIVRPPIVLGEGDRMGLPLFGLVVRWGVHPSPGFRPRRFSLIHAKDLVQLLILAADRGQRLPPADQTGVAAGQGYYFAGCDQDPTYPDLGRLVAQAAGRRVLVVHAVMPVVRTVATAGEVIGKFRRQPLVMNLDKFREIRAGSWICSTQAAKRDLGYDVGAPLVERLRQTIDWYRREKWL